MSSTSDLSLNYECCNTVPLFSVPVFKVSMEILEFSPNRFYLINMKRTLLLLILSTVTFFANAQFEGSKQVFESPKLKIEIAKHQAVAILPFEVKISYRKQPKSFNAEARQTSC